MIPIEYRFKSAIRQLAPWFTWAPVAQRPLVSAVTSYAGGELRQFRDLMARARTPVAILTAPSEILGNVGRTGWTLRYWVDSSVYGEGLGGFRNISPKTQIPLKLQSATGGFSIANKIPDQYLRLGRTDAGDPDGLRRAY